MDERERQELYRMMGENAGDGILFSDREGLIRLWNRGAERIFGFTAEEALGQSLDLIIPERLRARHWEGYRRVMETGVTRYAADTLAVPGLTRDGRTISLEFTVILVRGGTGEVGGVGAILRDVTARREAEKRLRERLRELEEMAGRRAAGEN